MNLLDKRIHNVFFELFHPKRQALDDQNIAEGVCNQRRESVAFSKNQPAAFQVCKSPPVFNRLMNTPENKITVNGFIPVTHYAQSNLALGVIECFCEKPVPEAPDIHDITRLYRTFRAVNIAPEYPRMPCIDTFFLSGFQNHSTHFVSPSVSFPQTGSSCT